MKRVTLTKPLSAAITVLLCATFAFSQQKTSKPKDTKQPKLLTVSNYMREMGLLYLEALQKYEDQCWKKEATLDSCDSAMKNFEEDGVLKASEDRMDMHLHDYPSEGDEAYRGLLKTTSSAEWFFMHQIWFFKSHTRTSEEMFKTLGLANTCREAAHEIAIKGIFDDGLWNCEKKFSEYLKDKS
jgi:hypothetical protein